MSTNNNPASSNPAAATMASTVASVATFTDPTSGSEADHDDFDNTTISESATGNKRMLSAGTTTKGDNGGGSGEHLSEKKLRRLEKNRLSARECRRRKREATELLERQINILEGENLRLRLQLQIGQEAEETSLHEQAKLTSEISALLQSGASETEIFATLEEFKEKYADYGKSRRSAIEFHLRNIERLLMPTQTTSIVMTAFQGGDAVAIGGATTALTTSSSATTTTTTATTSLESQRSDDRSSVESTVLLDLDNRLPAGSTAVKPSASEAETNSVLHSTVVTAACTTSSMIDEATTCSATPMDEHLTSAVSPSTTTSADDATTSDFPSLPFPNNLDPKSLFKYLVGYLDVTPQQAAALKDSRLVAQELDGCLDKALGVLGELRQRLAQTGDDLDAEFNHVRSILTPTQAAKFLVWVANNKACMHMLNELWDRVYAAPPEASSSTEHHDETVRNNNT